VAGVALYGAYFFIEGFIKGPVCRGQIALNVIKDRVWVVFTDPDVDLASSRPEFLEEMSDDLGLPAVKSDMLKVLAVWRDYARRQNLYNNAREANIAKSVDGIEDLNADMRYIWDGDGHNPNAALTIYRHFDSASVENVLSASTRTVPGSSTTRYWSAFIDYCAKQEPLLYDILDLDRNANRQPGPGLGQQKKYVTETDRIRYFGFNGCPVPRWRGTPAPRLSFSFGQNIGNMPGVLFSLIRQPAPESHSVYL
jgi:hypothetical protein